MGQYLITTDVKSGNSHRLEVSANSVIAANGEKLDISGTIVRSTRCAMSLLFSTVLRTYDDGEGVECWRYRVCANAITFLGPEELQPS